MRDHVYAASQLLFRSCQSRRSARAIRRRRIHVDLDQFFCAREEQRDSTLKGKPFAVGGRPEERGVVASASYAARTFGVRSAMPMAYAVRLCPELIVVRPNFPAYREASQHVMERLHALTDLVEQISIDEAFLDVSTLGEPGEQVASGFRPPSASSSASRVRSA